MKGTIISRAQLAKNASRKLALLSSKIKNNALLAIAKSIKENSGLILDANKKDAESARKIGIDEASLKRLVLDKSKIDEMAKIVKGIARLDEPVGKILSKIELDSGLHLCKVSCPIGVIAAVFESRPDALTQIIALCLKSANALILKGGFEAKNSNAALFRLISKAAQENHIPKGAIQIIETREELLQILKQHDYIDLAIPRGSKRLVKYIQGHTKIPVIGHSGGVCHVFVDKYANIKQALDICFDAKCQYPAACNAMETLLVHKGIAKDFLPLMSKKFLDAEVEIRGDYKTREIINHAKKAVERDWSTEYNGMVLSVKVVDDLSEAICHINKYGSRHTDAIVTKNKNTAELFMSLVDSSSVIWNASTRFADGYRYGKGAELGISSAKIHARGPVGLDGLVIYKYKLAGKGHIVKGYIGKNAKKFRHRIIIAADFDIRNNFQSPPDIGTANY